MVTETVLDGECLELVVVRRRGTVCVDVVDLFRHNARLPDRHRHHTARAVGILRRRCHMVGIAGEAVADDLRIDVRAAPPGELQFLENHHAGALADDEAVAILVEGPAGVRRIVVACGERPHRGKPADAHRRDGRLGPAGNHCVGIASLDDLNRFADGVRRCGARRAGRQIRTLGAETYRHLAGREIDDGGRDEERRDLARPAVEQGFVLPFDRAEAADTGPDEDAHIEGVLRRDAQPGVIHRELRRRNRVLDEEVHLLDVLLLDERQGIPPLDLSCDLRRETGDVEPRNRTHAALARE